MKDCVNQLKVIELFAGVGGFRLGFERCDKDFFNTIWANQWEPGQNGQWAYKCYEKHFDEGSCVNEDIATIIDEVPEHDLLVGGFPCQDYSVAHSLSSSKGIEGKKGVLWWSIDKIVKKRHPSYILLENVDRLLKSPAKQRGRDFGIILKCLSDEGYAVQWRVINAAEYGEVQRRRRIFIFATNERTDYYKKILKELKTSEPAEWMKNGSFFSKVFPVVKDTQAIRQSTIADFNSYEDIVDFSDNFKATFYNAGVLAGDILYTEELIPEEVEAKTLKDILSENVAEKYYITADEQPQWEYMKGAKKIERQSRDGFTYVFSEGSIAFPDPIDKPARTMLTSEGTKNRSSHLIADPITKRLRILTPEECELINGFDRGWTDSGMPERQRYFCMGNALVVPLIEKMGREIKNIALS